MAFASSSSVICQNRALSSSVVSSPALFHHRCFSRLQSQRILHCNRRSSSNIGINASPGASSVVAKTALSDAHVQSYSSCPAPAPGKYYWNNFLLLLYFVFVVLLVLIIINCNAILTEWFVLTF